MAPLSIGNLLLGTAMQPGMSAIASAYAESAASSNIPWSSLEYSGQTITGISGSGIGAQVDTSQFIPASASGDFFPASASGDFIPASASGDFIPASASGDFIPASASSEFQPSGDYAFNSSVSSIEQNITNIESSITAMSSVVSGLTGEYIPVSASSGFQPRGDYAYNSAVSGKADKSALDNCCSSMSSVVSAIETSVTAISSTVSGLTGTYIEQSASGMFAPSGDYAYNSSVSGKLDKSSQVVTSTAGGSGMVSAINGSAILDRDTHDGLTALSAEVATAIAIPMKPLVEGFGIDLTEGPDSVTISVTGTTGYIPSSASGNFQPASAMTAYLPASASSKFQPKSSMTAYLERSSSGMFAPSGDYAYNSAVTGKLDTSAVEFINVDGTVYVSSISGKKALDALSAVSANSADYAASAGTAADVGGMTSMQTYSYPGATSEKFVSGFNNLGIVASAAHISGDTFWNIGSRLSSHEQQLNAIPTSYIPASASSAFQPSGDYAYNSAVSGKAEKSACVTKSSIEGISSAITAIDGSAIFCPVSSVGTGSSTVETAVTSINGKPLSARGLVPSNYSTYGSGAVLMVTGNVGTYGCGWAPPSGYFLMKSAVSGSDGKISSINGSGILASSVVTATAGSDGMVTSINGSAISANMVAGTQWVSGTFGEYNYISSTAGVVAGKSGVISATSEVYNPDGTATSTETASAAMDRTGQGPNYYYTAMPFSALSFTSTTPASQRFWVTISGTETAAEDAVYIGTSVGSLVAYTAGMTLSIPATEVTGVIVSANKSYNPYYGPTNWTCSATATVTQNGRMETATSYMTADILASIVQ